MEDKQLIQFQSMAITKETVKLHICPLATDTELVMFLELCKRRRLNPFIKEVYLIKYSESQPASTVVAKDVFLTRANNIPEYRGFNAGVVLLNNKGAIVRTAGILLPDHKLIGGWSTVKRHEREDLEIEVNLEEYIGKKSNGEINKQWKSKPVTMIRKVALVHGHREAFPEEFGDMYDESELGAMQYAEVPAAEPNKKDVSQPQSKLSNGNGSQPQKGTRTEKGDSLADSIMDMANKMAGGDFTKSCDILEKHSVYQGKGLRTLEGASDGRLFHTNKSLSVEFDAWEKQNA
ncbi:hypothetical protein LCGC14_0452130 [marine sediment metagenome]|uniref:Phage recombination protein Bet n=1 Tax=marine sediment metagenome TaxID=412755 RepID=A0A0F9T0S5_9ZZZZ